MGTNIADQAKRLKELVEQYDSLDYSPEDQKMLAVVIGARLLSIDGELRSIAKHIDPTWRDEGGLQWNLAASLAAQTEGEK